MIPQQSLDAICLAAGLGVIGGIAVVEIAMIGGAFVTVTAALLVVAASTAAGAWVHPDAATTSALWEERELLEDGDRQ